MGPENLKNFVNLKLRLSESSVDRIWADAFEVAPEKDLFDARLEGSAQPGKNGFECLRFPRLDEKQYWIGIQLAYFHENKSNNPVKHYIRFRNTFQLFNVTEDIIKPENATIIIRLNQLWATNYK